MTISELSTASARLIFVEADAGTSHPGVQFAIATGEVMMYLSLAEPVVVQVVEACVREPGIERAKIREVEREIAAVVYACDEPDETVRLAGAGIFSDRLLDDLECIHGARDDLGLAVRQGFGSG